LRQDHDPGKQKLKGAVRTETYRRHYCQHLLCASISYLEVKGEKKEEKRRDCKDLSLEAVTNAVLLKLN
jgi:hypothetical protein